MKQNDDARAHSDKRLYIETYGCQMNVADSEVVAAVMDTVGYVMTDDIDMADAVLLNTCSIRDNAEQKIHSRLQYLASLKRKRHGRLTVGVIGCMAERVKDDQNKKPGRSLVARTEFFSGPACVVCFGGVGGEGYKCQTFHNRNLS